MNIRRMASDPRAGTDPGDLALFQPSLADPAPLTLALIHQWLSDITPQIGHRISAATYHRWRRDLRVWAHYCATVAGTDEPSMDTLRAFRDWAATRWSPRHTNNVLTAIRHCYNWAAHRGIRSSVSQGVPPMPVPAPTWTVHRDLADPATIAAATACIAGDGVRQRRDRAILWLLASAPIDTIAVHRATVGAIDLVNGTARLVVRGHRRPDTLINLPTQAVEALQAYIEALPNRDPQAPLFCGTRGAWSAHPISLVTVRHIVRRVAFAAKWGDAESMPVPTTRYPAVTPEHLSVQDLRGKLLLRLVACGAQARLALHRLTVERCDLVSGRIATGRSWYALDPETHGLLRAWIGSRTTGPVFSSCRGTAASASSLRAEAWRLVRAPSTERLPSAKDLKRANLITLSEDYGPSVAAHESGMDPDYIAERLSESA